MPSSGDPCGQPHPEQPGVSCTQRREHETCTGFDPTDDDLEWVDWPNPHYVLSKRVPRAQVASALSEMAARVRPATSVLDGFPAGLAGSTLAGTRWSGEQKSLVDAAILAVATRHAGGGEFTSDAIWDELNGAVPMTKGLTARLSVARAHAWIDSTGKVEISRRGGHHDHGQRLSVWYSLIPK